MTSLDLLLKRTTEMGASDIHLRSGSFPLIRVHGELQELKDESFNIDAEQDGLLDILTDDQKKLFEERRDLDFAYEIPGVSRYRANFLKHQRGIGAVFRVIPTRIPTLEELDLPQGVADLTEVDKGLIVVTGPTGSGKSTTLAAMIDRINNRRSHHIITIEDPLEFIHESKKCLVTHREVGAHTGSFASALRAALREAPDIILIGEMRDLETISLAITAAETGHLVFGTLHTITAASTIDRIIDVFPSDQQRQIRTMLSEALRGVVAQQLLHKAAGKGRIAAIEIMVTTSAISNLIREAKTHQIFSVIQTGKREGMQTMDQSIMELLKQRKVTFEEAFRWAIDKETFQRYRG